MPIFTEATQHLRCTCEEGEEGGGGGGGTVPTTVASTNAATRSFVPPHVINFFNGARPTLLRDDREASPAERRKVR